MTEPASHAPPSRHWRAVPPLAALFFAALISPALADPFSRLEDADLTPHRIFTLLFLMLGPIKILAPFVNLTRGADAAYRTRLATRAIAFSSAALAVGAILGQHFLDNFGVPVSVLTLTGGLVLFLVALQTVLQQFDSPSTPHPEPVPRNLRLAINPLAFPTIVTPYGMAAIIIFMAVAGDNLEARLTVAAVAAVVLALDWVAMIFAHIILRYVGTALQIFAVVLGITQVALGLQIILLALSNIGVFSIHPP